MMMMNKAKLTLECVYSENTQNTDG